MFDVRVIPQRPRPGQPRAGGPTTTARTLEVASAIVANPVSSVRVAHLSLDEQLATVVREISSRPDVRLVLRPCDDGAYLVIEAAPTAGRANALSQPRASWATRFLSWIGGGV